ncbi:hypothetical protein [Nocardioides cynanchi]|uniref:hypothetical protein n=1 Tax=Nocardioides cynanchi TaxID=2558918 RepID=UPI001248259E|nr:hypothetical protein [Nocardioides cynanchi]
MSARAGRETDGEARAWGWVAHLRSGGTTSWSRWADPAPAREQAGRYLPGAQQLELLRRLNVQRVPRPELAERVLSASAPGRGRPDLGLVGVLPATRFGPPPVDPEDLPPDELVRVATALIAEDVVAAGDPPAPREARRFRRRYRLLGDPELARPLREQLTADGRPPGGAGATVVVLGTDVERMLVHAWTARCFGTEGVRPWPEWVAAAERTGALPPRIDLAEIARTWSARVGAGRTHVVLDDPRHGARLAGLRRPSAPTRDLSADAVELARRTGPVLGSLVPPERRALLLWHRLRPLLAGFEGATLHVPERHLPWLSGRTADLRERLAGGNYAVHGDLPDLDAPAPPGDRAGRTRRQAGVSAPDDERVLALAMQVLLGPPVGARDAGTDGEGEGT